MDIKVYRFDSGSDDTIGRLYIDGVFKCYTLEDQFREVKVKGDTRIAAGTYPVELVHSPRFTPIYGHKMLHVMNVPKFEGILIHPGNTEADTEGCLLVGKRIGSLNSKRAVLDSKNAYREIYPLIAEAIQAGDKVFINYMDHDIIKGV